MGEGDAVDTRHLITAKLYDLIYLKLDLF